MTQMALLKFMICGGIIHKFFLQVCIFIFGACQIAKKKVGFHLQIRRQEKAQKNGAGQILCVFIFMSTHFMPAFGNDPVFPSICRVQYIAKVDFSTISVFAGML